MSPAGNPDMSQLLAQAQQLQEQLVAAQDRLAGTQVTGSAASGLVTATVTGTGDLVSVAIKPEACDPEDAETLGDMVVAAVRNANEHAQQLAAEQLGPVAGGLQSLEGLGGASDRDDVGPGTGPDDARPDGAARPDDTERPGGAALPAGS